ncbi:MAG: PepSY-associated TM helix domain-containing protein [Pseudomonadota bacterium]
MKSGIRDTMTWFHTWIGLVLCWVMYFMFVTGTTGYFDEEIDQYMMPEIAHHEQVSLESRFETLMNYGNQNALGAEQWFLTPEAFRGGMLSRIFYRLPQEEDPESLQNFNITMNPKTGESIEGTARETAGGQTLYRMHWRLHYINPDLAYYLIGVVTLFMFIGVVSGIVIHRKIFTDFFTFRNKSNGKGWLDAHNLMSVSSLPFQLMIAYSGLLFMVTTFLPVIGYASYGFDVGKTIDAAQSLRISYKVEASGRAADMLAPNDLMTSILEKVDRDDIKRINVKHPGDENAVIIVRPMESIYGARSAEGYVFSAVTGEYIETLPHALNAAMQINTVMLDLHEGLFAKTDLRWLYFVAGILGSGMIASGSIYYVRKRRVKLGPNAEMPRNLRNIESGNIAVTVGLMAGIAAFFIANRLLPVEMDNRADWEVHCMFIVWGLCFVHAFIRTNSQAWKEQCYFTSLLYLALPFINGMTIDQHLFNAINEGNWIFASTDLLSILFSLIFGAIAFQMGKKVTLSRPKMRTAPTRSAMVRDH